MALKDDMRFVTDEFLRLSGRGGTRAGMTSAFNPSIQAHLSTTGVLEHNRQLFDIFEGALISYVQGALKEQFSEKSYEAVKHRVSPINVLPKIIDKLSKLYAKAPERTVTTPSGEASDSDKELLAFYEESLCMNTSMGIANEFFNLFKGTFLKPYLCEGKPRLRVMPYDRFFVMSLDPLDPLKVTHYVEIIGTFMDESGKADTMVARTLLYVYTDEEFLAVDERGVVRTEIMQKLDNTAGINPIGKIPGVYIRKSKHDLIPRPDTDTLQMTKLIPVLLSDCNYVSMYTSFPIVYGVDLDDDNLTRAPNAFWNFKSDPSKPDSKPSIGVLKPEGDTDKILKLAETQLTMWMQARNIKAGGMGQLSVQNAASGIAKAIDEMDTSEDRQKQVPFFKDAECELWDLIINNYHPIWMQDPDFEMKMSFSPGAKVTTVIAEQRPELEPGVVIDNEIKKLGAGLQSQKRAIQAINPDLDDSQVEELMGEIKEEKTVNIADMQAAMGGKPQGGDPQDPESAQEDQTDPADQADGGAMKMGGDSMMQKGQMNAN